jgi:hypothetical protein
MNNSGAYSVFRDEIASLLGKKNEAVMTLALLGHRFLKGRMALLMLAAGLVAITAAAQVPNGQEDNGPPAGMAGGRMVRGTVTVVAPDKLMVKTEAGDVYQVALSANTRLMKARQPVKVADIKAGDGLGAMGVLDAPTKTVHALFVTVVDAEEVKKMREGLGKVYIAGKITAMDDLKLTVQRTDGVSQVIEVDEGTSFKKGGRALGEMLSGGFGMGMGGGRRQGGGQGNAGGTGTGAGAGAGAGTTGAAAGPARAGGGEGESITLADVKVGDTVAGRGGLKNGVFVPTELGVVDAAAMGQRRRREAGEGAPTAAAPGSSAGAAAATHSGGAAPQ